MRLHAIRRRQCSVRLVVPPTVIAVVLLLLLLWMQDGLGQSQETSKVIRSTRLEDYRPSSQRCVELLTLWECVTPARCLAIFQPADILRWVPAFLRNSCRSLIEEIERDANGSAQARGTDDPKPSSESSAAPARARIRPGDIVLRSQTQSPLDDHPLFIEPARRKPFMTPFPPSLTIHFGKKRGGSDDLRRMGNLSRDNEEEEEEEEEVLVLHPVSMAIPREMFLSKETRRTIRLLVEPFRVQGEATSTATGGGSGASELSFSPLYPRSPDSAAKRYGVNHEVLAIMSTMHSLFGITTRRAGWDASGTALRRPF